MNYQEDQYYRDLLGYEVGEPDEMPDHSDDQGWDIEEAF